MKSYKKLLISILIIPCFSWASPKVVCEPEFSLGLGELEIEKSVIKKTISDNKKIEVIATEELEIPNPLIEKKWEYANYRYYYLKNTSLVVHVTVGVNPSLDYGGRIGIEVTNLEGKTLGYSNTSEINLLQPGIYNSGNLAPSSHFSALKIPELSTEKFFTAKVQCYAMDFFDESVLKKNQKRPPRFRLRI
ncbi:MAG: hypothetical protein VX642_00995 [Bdellovibrionota bacterium]|nr:hypothetical protein [Bdellovibrionota bacterium]